MTGKALIELGSSEAPEVVDGELVKVDGRTLRGLETRAVTAVKQILVAEVKRTDLYRKLAGIICELRKVHRDWAGTSQAYRDTVARIYESAGVPTDSTSSLQASIRYHVSTELRQIAPPAELEAAGLKPESARERQAGRSKVRRSGPKQFTGSTAGKIVHIPNIDDLPSPEEALRSGMAMVFQAEQLLDSNPPPLGRPRETFMKLIDELEGSIKALKKRAAKMPA